MSIERRKQLLRALAFLVALAAASLVAWPAFFPARLAPPEVDEPGAGLFPRSAERPAVREPDLERLKALIARGRHVSVPEPEPEDSASGSQADASAPPPPPPDPLPVELVGILYEPSYAMALFRRPDGRVVVRGPGERIEAGLGGSGPVTVLEVGARSVRLRHGGRERTLALPEP